MVAWRQKCTCVSSRRTIVNIQSTPLRTTSARDPGPIRGATFITKLAMMGLGKNSPEKTPFSRGISHVELFRTQGHPKNTGNTTMVVLEKFSKPGEFAIFAAQETADRRTHCFQTLSFAPCNNSAEKTALSPRKRGCARAGTRKTLESLQCSRGNNSAKRENTGKTSTFRDPFESRPCQKTNTIPLKKMLRFAFGRHVQKRTVDDFTGILGISMDRSPFVRGDSLPILATLAAMRDLSILAADRAVAMAVNCFCITG
jgi:hypothetical protein